MTFMFDIVVVSYPSQHLPLFDSTCSYSHVAFTCNFISTLRLNCLDIQFIWILPSVSFSVSYIKKKKHFMFNPLHLCYEESARRKIKRKRKRNFRYTFYLHRLPQSYLKEIIWWKDTRRKKKTMKDKHYDN